MSFETSFKLISDELSYLKNLFVKEVDVLKRQSEGYLAELNGLRLKYDSEIDETRRRSGESAAEAERLRAEYERERRNWDDSRDIFQQNIVDLENEIIKMSESFPREKDFLECLPHMAFICGADGEVTYANQAFHNCFDAGAGGWFPFGRAALDSAKERGSWGRHITLVSKNGDEINVDAKLFSWNSYSGETGGYIGVASDLTNILEAEEEKQRLRQELYSVNALLSAEIDRGANSTVRKELRCVVIGGRGSGKSALINSLLGEALLPEGTAGPDIPIRCGRGAEKTLAAHYWNGGRRSFYRGDVTRERVEGLLAEEGLLWIELRVPDAAIPYGVMLEEAGEMPGDAVSNADAFIFLSRIRSYPSARALDRMRDLLSEGVYGIFALSKMDLECDDNESERNVLTAASKIGGAMNQIRRSLRGYPALRASRVLPISARESMNLDLIVWHLEEMVSPYQTLPGHSPEIPPLRLPESGEGASEAEYSNVLAPMLKAFHEQEFQSEFMRFITSAFARPGETGNGRRAEEAEKIKCLFISRHRESVHKLIARLAHDVSYARALEGTEGDWAANFDGAGCRRISVPESVLSGMSLLITPELFDAGDTGGVGDGGDGGGGERLRALLGEGEYIPVLVLELAGGDPAGELSDAAGAFRAALSERGFCVVSGEGRMIGDREAVSRSVNEWAGRDVPLFIYENYDVMMRSITHE